MKCWGCREKEGLLVEQRRHFAAYFPIQGAWEAFQKCKLQEEKRLEASNSEYGDRKSKLQPTTWAGWEKVEITDTRCWQMLRPQQYFGKWPKRILMLILQGNCRVLWLQVQIKSSCVRHRFTVICKSIFRFLPVTFVTFETRLIFLYSFIFASLFCNLFVSFILVLTVFIEFLKNLNKQQFDNQRLTNSLE